MNSFGLPNDSKAQSGPGGQVAVVEGVYDKQRDDEHAGRVDEPRSAGMRRSAVDSDTFDEGQVTFTALRSTTPWSSNFKTTMTTSRSTLLTLRSVEATTVPRRAVISLWFSGPLMATKVTRRLPSLLLFSSPTRFSMHLVITLTAPHPQILTRPADSNDEAEVQVISEAHASFLEYLSDLHADELHTEQVPSGMFTFNRLYPP